jgi:hypothetical protein
VNKGNAATAGFANDRNPAIGSGGYNRPGGSFDAGFRSNAIITGNVTGLAGFKGFSPILQTNAFRDDLQSTSLTGFLGRSVGVADVRQNSVPPQGYFFDPTRTVIDAGIATRGASAPGPSRVISNALAPPTIGAFGMRQVGPEIKNPQDKRLGVNAIPPVTPARRLPASAAQIQNRVRGTPFRSAMQSTIFGSSLNEDTAPPDDLSPIPVQPGLERTDGGLPLPPERPADREQKPSGVSDVFNGSLNRLGQEPKVDEVTPGTRQRTIGGASEVAVEGAAEDGPPGSGLDRFADMSAAARLLKSGAGAPSAPQSPAVGAGDVAVQTEGLPTAATVGAELKWATKLKDAPIKSFVGANSDRLNGYLASAEETLHAGQFYKASRIYDLASTMDPSNPLPLLGRGHALAAAGDFRSAVYSLLAAVKNFPEIASFNLDLTALVGQTDTFDRRRAELETMLRSGDDPGLRFLLGYLEYFSGLTEPGRRNLIEARNSAAQDSPIIVFVDRLTSTVQPESTPGR